MAATPPQLGYELVGAVRRCAGTLVSAQAPVEIPSAGAAAAAWAAPAVFGGPGFGPVAQAAINVVLSAAGDGSAASCSWVLGFTRTGRPVVRVADGPTAVELVGARAAERLQWTLLALALDDRGEVLQLRVDGEVVASAQVPDGWRLGGTRAAAGGVLGAPEVDGVATGAFHGLLAGAVVGGDVTIGRPEIEPAQAWSTPLERFSADRDRPRYHFVPPAGWMNEPHGIVHHAGRHHLFYQRNELGAFWSNISWGHAVSDDLIHWTDLGHALAPWTLRHAPDGVWSGSATVDETGRPMLFYTAGDTRDDPNQRTAWALAADPTDPDLRMWTEGPEPVTTLHDSVPALRAVGIVPLAGQFRDPFVWRDADVWFQLVGAGIEGRGGAALLFRATSPASGAWEFIRPLLIGDAETRPDTGVMWELPTLVPVGRDVDGRMVHALFVTPWWPEPTEHSLLHEWYWLGTWDATAASFTPHHEEPRSLDVGGFFTGVTSSIDATGRTLLWSIAQDLLAHEEHLARGWAGNAGLPVHVWYEDGELRVAPVGELRSLREEAVLDLAGEVAAAAGSTVVVDVGPMWEAWVEAELPVGGHVDLRVRVDSAGAAAIVTIERTGADEGAVRVLRPDGPVSRRDRSASVRLPRAEPVRLHVFVDHSMVEVWVQDRMSVTTRAWAGVERPDRSTVAVLGSGNATRLQVWRLRAAVVRERLAS